MNYLNQRINTIEQKLKATHQHLFYQEEEYSGLLEKMQDIKLKYSRAVLLLTEFIESFVEQNPNLLQQQSDMFLDIDNIKEAEDMHDVQDETIVALCLVLLKQLQPYITDLSDSKHQQNYERRYLDPVS